MLTNSTEETRQTAPWLAVTPSERRPRVLVAGGAGFLGAHLCRRLLESGAEVICLDSLVTGARQNLAPLWSRPGFSFVTQDVIDPIEIEGPLDRIYNMACPASPPRYAADPIHTLRTSVEGALRLLELARKSSARILLASTSEVYGDPTVTPQPESYRGNVATTGPRACYDEGKRAAETLFHDFGARHAVETRIARIFNTYGPGMDPQDGRAVPTFVAQALAGEDITVHGDGAQTRSFCYVDDLIDGLVALMENGEGFAGPVNLGNPAEVTIGDVAKMIRDAAGSSSRIVFTSRPQHDPERRCPDITLARERLEWAPKVALDEGLAATVADLAARIGPDRPEAASGGQLQGMRLS
jgi:UDP-glucuronate decarboxylase